MPDIMVVVMLFFGMFVKYSFDKHNYKEKCRYYKCLRRACMDESEPFVNEVNLK